MSRPSRSDNSSPPPPDTGQPRPLRAQAAGVAWSIATDAEDWSADDPNAADLIGGGVVVVHLLACGWTLLVRGLRSDFGVCSSLSLSPWAMGGSFDRRPDPSGCAAGARTAMFGLHPMVSSARRRQFFDRVGSSSGGLHTHNSGAEQRGGDGSSSLRCSSSAPERGPLNFSERMSSLTQLAAVPVPWDRPDPPPCAHARG